MTDPDIHTRVAVLEAQRVSDQEHKALQAIEYERRLTDLNHAHEKQVADQATYISGDKFEGFVREFYQWRDQTQKTLTLLEGRTGGSQDVLLKWIPWAIAIGSSIALLWDKAP